MADSSQKLKIIDKLSDISFQAEIELIYILLRWNSFPSGATESFKSTLKQRAQNFTIEEYLPSDDDTTPAVPYRIFHTGAPESSGDERIGDPLQLQLELEVESSATQAQQQGPWQGNSKRLVISHPQQQQNILCRSHDGNGENHLSSDEMLEKLAPLYYWKDFGTSIMDFVQSCEKCREQSSSPMSVNTDSVCDDSFQDDHMEEMNSDIEDDSNERMQFHREVPYAEEIDHLYTYLTTGKYPPSSSGTYKRNIRRRSNRYALGVDDGYGKANGKRVIYLLQRERKSTEKGKRKVVSKKLVITEEEEQQKILQRAHVGPTGKHHGRDKTSAVLTKQYFWKGIHLSIATYIKSCRECQQKDFISSTSLKRKNAAATKKIRKVTRDDRSACSQKEEDATRIKSLREKFARTTMDTFNYLKYQVYPSGSSINAKRVIRKRAVSFSIGLADTKDWMEICGLTQPEERLFFIQHNKHYDNEEEGEDSDDDRPTRRLVVTTEMQRKAAVMQVHITEKGKHLPREETVKRLIGRYFWVKMRVSVRMYLKDCPCPHHKTTPHQASPSQSPSKTHSEKLPIKMEYPVPTNAGMSSRCSDPLPQEFSDLPKGISSWTCFTPEEVQLVLYVYLKWGKYPAECRDNFKRVVRRKACSFLYYEEMGGDGLSKWHLYSKRKARQSENRESVGDTESQTNCTVACPLSPEDSDTETSETQEEFNPASLGLIRRNPVKPPKCLDPLPRELADLPKGLSSLLKISTEQLALITYVYLKWQRYPAQCTHGFKRALRRRVESFVYEEEAENGVVNWYLYYKGRTKETEESLQTQGDSGFIGLQENNQNASSSFLVDSKMECPGLQENGRMEMRSDENEVAMAIRELTGANESTVTNSPQILPGETEAYTAVTATPMATAFERTIHYKTTKRLAVYRKDYQERVLKYLHENIRPNGQHAGRDKMLCVLNRNFYWNDVCEDVRKFIKGCWICQASKCEGEEESLYSHMSQVEKPEEEHSHHELPSFIQTYMENALRRDAELEAKDREANQAMKEASVVSSHRPVLEVNRSGCDLEIQGDASVQSTEPNGDSSRIHSCDLCPMKYRLKRNLYLHKRKEHRNPYIPCHVCGKVYKGRKTLKDHMRVHSNERPLECEYCGKRFRFRGNLCSHRKMHLGLKPFTCKECPQRFISRSVRNRHFKIYHEGNGTYLCDICAKSFTTPLQLKNHMRVHERTRESYACQVCCKQLSSRRNLKLHMLIHTGVRHFFCEKCGKGYKTLNELNRHMMHHMQVKPCKCHLCEKSFCRKSDLEDHIRSHQGASMYPCHVCHKQFKNRRSVDRCMLRHNRQTFGMQGFQ